MRILLIGEYSGFHNALKKGLQSLGHEITLVGDGDGFKGYNVDIYVGSDYYRRNKWRKKLMTGWYKLTGTNLEDGLRLKRFRESEHLLKNYDIIQFVNSNPFNCEPAVEWEMLNYLLQNNGKALLVACGDDAPYATYLSTKHKGYSILQPEPDVKMPSQHVIHTLKYLKKDYQLNYQRLLEKCDYIIPSNTDYAAALTTESKATGIIPAPVQTDRLPLKQNKNLEVIELFMGVNSGNYWKKGINYFEQALEKIKVSYGNRVNITIAKDLPYTEYIKAYNNCHILLDQVLCYDQGYNALEAMAQGKVVFAGGSDVYLKAHGLTEIPVIDAQPDVNYLVAQLTAIIDNPQTILEIGAQARQHVLSYHNYKAIARRYETLYNA